MKTAPDYCNIYVIAKGKSVNVRLAKCGVPVVTGADISLENSDSFSSRYTRRGSRGHLPPATPDATRRSIDCRIVPELTTRPPFRERSLPSPRYGDGSVRSTRRSNSHDSLGSELDFSQSARFSTVDFVDNLDTPTNFAGSSGLEPMSPSAGVSSY